MPDPEEAGIRAEVKALARAADRMAARNKVMQGEIASLRTSLALILDELDSVRPIPGPSTEQG